MPHSDIISLSPMDTSFLLMESRNAPAHFAGLEIFSHPKNHRGSLFKDLVKKFGNKDEFTQPFNQRLIRGSWWSLRPPRWHLDEHFDFDYHVRHLAVPPPGRMEDLLKILARIHARPMNPDHPLWEYYFIDGLPKRQFAVYRKTHHSLVDGVGSIALLKKSYAESPDVPMERAPWNPHPRQADGLYGKSKKKSPSGNGAGQTIRDLAGFTMENVRARISGQRDVLTLPWQAPASPINVAISPHRRICLRTFPLDEMREEAHRLGVTINDIFVTMCAGTLRHFLLERDQLPRKTMTAMIPVSVRGKEADTRNKIVFVVCELGTHLDTTRERFRWIVQSMNQNREFLEVLPGPGAAAISLGFDLAWIAQKGLLRTIPGIPPIANLVISNVPGPRRHLYMDGARLEGIWPLSVLMDGQALNITVTSYVDQLHVGVVSCRDVVENIEKIGTLLEEEFAAIKKIKE